MSGLTIGTRNELNLNVLGSLHVFRHDVFVRRLGWELPLLDGMERDRYDRDDTIYLTMTDRDQRVTAFARLLPTVRSYMLPELFPELLGQCAAPCDPAVWELSRFATSVRASREGRVMSLSQPTLDLLGAVLSFASRQSIERLILVTTIAMERLLLHAGCDVHRIAAPAHLHGRLHVALYIEVPR